MAAATIFIMTYIGIALGRIPGLVIDRVGIALIGAIAMVVFNIISVKQAINSIDFPTILLLFGLMIISAQLRLGGFYSWSATRIMFLLEKPRLFLLNIMLLSALLSSVLANDIVCFAFTPVLAFSLSRSGVNPLPFLLGLAVSSNIGSAATIIGNPQNMLIGQVGQLDFGKFLSWCAPPSLLALSASYLVILWIFRGRFPGKKDQVPGKNTIEGQWPSFNLWQSSKGIFAICALLLLFLTPVPREISAIGIAGVLLCSRKMRTKDILVLVDWHLIILFCALFIIIQGISQQGILDILAAQLDKGHISMHTLPVLAGISAVMSNMVSNVPAVMILVRFLDNANPAEWYTLAVSSTFAGNLITIGSIANLIVIEQAAHFGVTISFRQHAAAGIPVTVASFAVLIFWLFI
jgi:Na+/H+ antiporter NhaD/arsenite permease-like protein